MAASVSVSILVWEWKNDCQRWMPYGVSTTNFIESMKHTTEPFSLQLNGLSTANWTVDCKKMEQKNPMTGQSQPTMVMEWTIAFHQRSSQPPTYFCAFRWMIIIGIEDIKLML